MRPQILSVVFALAAGVGTASAQPAPLPNCDALVASVRAASDDQARLVAATALVKLRLHPSCLAEVIALGAVERASFGQFLKGFEAVRTDKQSGSSAGTGGSTNLVAKGSTARILSLAAEYGALTESVSKQVVTVQGSLDAIPAAAVRHNLVPYCPDGDRSSECIHEGAFEALRRISYSVSFDTSQGARTVSGTASGPAEGASQPVTFDASGRTVTAASVRYVIVNKRDAVSKEFQAKWTKELKATAPTSPIGSTGADLFDAMQTLLNEVDNDPTYRQWQTDTIAALTTTETVDETWLRRARVLAHALRAGHQDVYDHAAEFLQAYWKYRFEQARFVSPLANKPVLALEYSYNRRTGEPATSSGRLIFDKGIGKNWSIAANAAIEIFDEQPSPSVADVRRVRDAQAAVQIQRDLGSLLFLGAAAFSGSYYFQYQVSPSLLDVKPGTPLPGITFIGLPSTATQVFAEKGSIHVAQLRLMLGPAGSSARFPLSVAFANRTELITKPIVRAQIGISYDFDSLFAR